jgi:hypothetical protein
MSDQRHAPTELYLRERTTATHWIGGWVAPGAGLGTEARAVVLNLGVITPRGNSAYLWG